MAQQPPRPVKTYQDREAWILAVLGSRVCSGAKVTAIDIGSHLNFKTGQCNPSVRTISVETNQEIRSVERHLPVLRNAGLLTWESTKGQSSNRYVLTTPSSEEDAVVLLLGFSAHVQAGLRRARLNEYEIGCLAGATVDEGPPITFTDLNFRQATILRKHHPELNDVWPGVRIGAVVAVRGRP